MPIKWTPEVDQILLLKILETHNISVDTKAIVAKWPSSMGEKPTARAISERIVKIRNLNKQNGGGHFLISGKGGARSSHTTTPANISTSASVKTSGSIQKSHAPAKGKVAGKNRITVKKEVIESIDDDDDDDSALITHIKSKAPANDYTLAAPATPSPSQRASSPYPTPNSRANLNGNATATSAKIMNMAGSHDTDEDSDTERKKTPTPTPHPMRTHGVRVKTYQEPDFEDEGEAESQMSSGEYIGGHSASIGDGEGSDAEEIGGGQSSGGVGSQFERGLIDAPAWKEEGNEGYGDDDLI